MARKTRSRKRTSTSIPQIPKIQVPQASDNAGHAVIATAMESRPPRRVDIPRQLIRHVTESHWSDGTIEKSDRTYPVNTTQSVYG